MIAFVTLLCSKNGNRLQGKALSFVGTKEHRGNFVIGVSPSAIFTISLDGTRRRELQRETLHLVSRNPIWTR